MEWVQRMLVAHLQWDRGGLQCALISNPAVAQTAGIRLGWRVNVDTADGKAWCPKGVLDNSKLQPEV